MYGRREYLAIGEPLVQAFSAEHHATQQEVVASPRAWELIAPYFTAQEVLDDGFVFISSVKEPLRKTAIKTKAKTLGENIVKRISTYIPTAVVPFATQNDDKWVNELRQITVLFVNLGVNEAELVSISSSKDIMRIHNVLRSVQQAVYRYEGSLNKFLMDDKGSTLVAVWGLPPLAHDDDALRGVLAALDICNALHQLDLRPSVGITTGAAFCGVVGARVKFLCKHWQDGFFCNLLLIRSQGRREYTVLGDTVNLSARMMQYATVTGCPIVCDEATTESASYWKCWTKRLKFHNFNRIRVKGKTQPISVYKPVLLPQPASAVHLVIYYFLCLVRF